MFYLCLFGVWLVLVCAVNMKVITEYLHEKRFANRSNRLNLSTHVAARVLCVFIRCNRSGVLHVVRK